MRKIKTLEMWALEDPKLHSIGEIVKKLNEVIDRFNALERTYLVFDGEENEKIPEE